MLTIDLNQLASLLALRRQVKVNKDKLKNNDEDSKLKTRFTASEKEELKALNPLDAVSNVMIKARKVIVVTGAGISCSSGIPDFRSADGLYNLVKSQYPKTVVKGKDLFDANLFRDCATTAVFYTFISELHAKTLEAKPSATHHFIKLLAEKGKLLRCYTQNIDCLEQDLGMATELVCEKGKVKKDVNVVQLHGTLRKLKCTSCPELYDFGKDFEKVFREGEAPYCPNCEGMDLARLAAGKRRHTTGVLRPAIVLYNENHPLGDAIGSITVSDLGKSPDVLLVMGTSLKVHGLRLLVRKAAKVVHGSKKGGCVILVNKTPIAGKEWAGVFDYFIQGETDDWCQVVEDALRQVKVQSKLPFKPVCEASSAPLSVSLPTSQDCQSSTPTKASITEDKENYAPILVEDNFEPANTGRKRSFAIMLGKKSTEEIVSESIRTALGTVSNQSSAPTSLVSTRASSPLLGSSAVMQSPALPRNNSSNYARKVSSPKKKVSLSLSNLGSKQNLMAQMNNMHVSKGLRRPTLGKVVSTGSGQDGSFKSMKDVVGHQPALVVPLAEIRRTRSSGRLD